MIILYDNKVSTSIISSSSENPNFPWSSALNDTILARTGRTIGDSAEWIKFIFPAAISVTSFAILNHNFEAAATVKIQGNSSDSWTTPPVDRTQTISNVIYDSFASSSYRYWRVYMDHAASTAGYFSLSKIYLGLSYTPINQNAGIDMPLLVESNTSKSRGGQVFGQTSTKLRTYRLALSGLTQSQMDSYQTFHDSVDNYIPFIFIPFESNTSTIPPIYANANSHGAIRLAEDQGVYYDITGIEFQECK